MSAQSFKVAINKEDFDIINQNSEIETYEVDGSSILPKLGNIFLC
jgi:hypothetical protein